MHTELPHSPACERNREPILRELARLFTAPGDVLEIGSGTGQHAAWFARAMPHLRWQASDRQENLPGIEAWRRHLAPESPQPLVLDVLAGPWPAATYEYVFSANTMHIMAWPAVEAALAGVGQVLVAQGFLALYGPFKRGGEFTSASNAEFDRQLRQRDPGQGIRDREALAQAAQRYGLRLCEEIELPANNELLVFVKTIDHRDGGQPHIAAGRSTGAG